MAVHVVAQLTINEDQAFALSQYLEKNLEKLEQVGGKVISRFPLGESVVGQSESDLVVIVEFPDQDAVYTMFESEEYKSSIPMRDIAFSRYSVSLALPDSEAAIQLP